MVPEHQFSLWGGETGADLQLQIEQQGYALLEHNIPSDAIDDMVAAYAEFTDNHPDPETATMDAMISNTKDLDKLHFTVDQQKEWHKYRTNVPFFAKPNGYTNRSFQAQVLSKHRNLDIKEDPKEYFHYAPGMREKLTDRHERFGWGPMPPEVERLLGRMHVIHYMAKQAISKFYASLEGMNPGLAQFVTPKDLDISPVRGLFYHKGQGEILAGGHHDRGLGTLQIAESHLGLRVRDPQTNAMIEINRDPQYGVAFPAVKWKQALPDTTLRSLWHDVINIEQECPDRHLHGRNIARWAIIFFTNSKRVGEHQVKANTHTETLNEQVA
jgi:hypothetical protein